jgi:hypothetical protein
MEVARLQCWWFSFLLGLSVPKLFRNLFTISPFFQTVKVMATILRARVRRAIGGFIPLATRAV